ncbi:hypothetical protein BDN72DRAFT_855800 [Pluteus cervinus]|uniref:Uncharacterized protein n=1 Tax=Pluteus cervinus TaxID=181527 RepID=A0ACD3B340_9AGAR|nr:hypothetical protein BDN72DRAFT_855800 [Pluteus cervinus]
MGNAPSSSGLYQEYDVSNVAKVKDILKTVNISVLDSIKNELLGFDLVVVVDNSAAMKDDWQHAHNTLLDLFTLAGSYDPDGFDLCVVRGSGLGHVDGCTPWKLEAGMWGLRGVMPDRVHRVSEHLKRLTFSDNSSSLYHTLDELLKAYRADIERWHVWKRRKLNCIVLTSHCRQATEMEELIQKTAKWTREHRLPDNQVGFQFVQLGDDMKTSAFMGHLDEKLKYTHSDMDIVDRTHLKNPDESTLVKILLGGVLRREDIERVLGQSDSLAFQVLHGMVQKLKPKRRQTMYY